MNYTNTKMHAFIEMLTDMLRISGFAEDRQFIADATGLKITRADYNTYRTNPQSPYKDQTIAQALKEKHAEVVKDKTKTRDDADYLVLRAVTDSGVQLTPEKRKNIHGALLSRYDRDVKKNIIQVQLTVK